MKKIILSFLLLFGGGFAQTPEKTEKEGLITYISSKHTYIKFENTAGIQEGDTVFTKDSDGIQDAGVVKYISTSSCAAEMFRSKKELKAGDKLYVYIFRNKADTVDSELINNNTPDENLPISSPPVQKKSNKIKMFSGRFSVQSYSSISNVTGIDDFQRWRYTLSFNSKDLGNSGISVSTYANFNYRADEWKNISSNASDNFKIYDLSVGYNFSPSSRIWIGRHISGEVSNLGAVDGLQFESRIGESNFVGGVIAGFRPDFSDLGFNSKLLEAGAFITRYDSSSSGIMKNSIGFFEQTNNSKTDRRFIYLQHSDNLLENFNFFFSSEIDLYKKIKEIKEDRFILTSLFLSAKYSPARLLSLSLSYDARKNVIYYETFKNFIDSLFENETRQGFSARVTLRPLSKLNVGLSSGYRYRKGDFKPGRNYGISLLYTSLPFIQVSSAFSYTRLISSYADASLYGIRLSRNIFNYLDLSAAFRRTDYRTGFKEQLFTQNIFSVDLNSRIFNFIFLSVGYEGIFHENDADSRIFLDLTTRF